MSRVDPGLGLLLLEERVSSDTQVALGASAAESAYTETGPHIPGHPVVTGRWRPQVSGAQSVALDLRTSRGGYPGRDAAAVVYKLTSDTSSDSYRGWNDANLLVNWTAPTDGWGGSKVFDTLCGCVNAATGVLYLTAVDAGTGAAFTWSYDPRTRVWTTLQDWTAAGLDGLTTPVGMAYDAERERVIVYSGGGATGTATQAAYYSNDSGLSWAIYSRGYLNEDGFSAGRYQIVPHPTGSWLMIALDDVDGSGVGVQWSSDDAGVTWRRVQPSSSLTNVAHSAALGPAGFCVVRRVDASGLLQAQIIADAGANINDAAVIAVHATYTSSNHWLVADDDGVLYLYSAGGASDGNARAIAVFRSSDGGLTWVLYDEELTDCGDGTHYLQPHQALASGGQIHLVTTSIGSTDTDGTIALMSCGGWSQVAMAAGTRSEADEPEERGGWGGPRASTGAATTYVPIALPASANWTNVTTTGTTSLTTAPGLRLTTTAGQGQRYKSLHATSNSFGAAIAYLKPIAGSAAIATLSHANPGLSLVAALSTGAVLYRAVVGIGTDGLELYDHTVSTLTSASVTTTSGIWIAVQIRTASVTCWYSLDGVTWVRWADNQTLVDRGASGDATDYVEWGNFVGAAGDAYWYLVGGTPANDWRYGSTTAAAVGSTPATAVLGHQYGHSVPGRGSRYPIRELTGSGEDLGWLSAVGGPTYYAEAVELPVGHVYPIESIYPTESPSPRRRWVAADNTAVRLVWDQGSDQSVWWGGAVGMVIAGQPAPASWVLQRSGDGIAWTTIGTLDLTLGSGLAWVRSGQVVTPNTGTATISTWIAEDALVGGYVDLDGSPRRILRNGQGYWSSTAGIQQVRITLDGITGAEASSGTAGAIVAPGGVLVAYQSSDVASRYLRVTVTASQAAPGSQYAAGLIGIGRIVGVGADPAWTWTEGRQRSVRQTRGSDGLLTQTELGPPVRVRSYAWPDGQALHRLRLLSTPADYVSASGSAPIGSVEDVPLALGAWIEHALSSGQTPCVLLPRLPSTTSTLLDPSLWIYGTVTGEVTLGGVVGTEGVDEVVTVGALTVTEIR